MDVDTILKVVRELGIAFGPIIGTMLFLLIFIIVVILWFFKQRVSGIANEISEKSIIAFNKKIDLLFRDEILRNNLRLRLGEKSVEKKLTLYEEIYALYLKYQAHWFFKPKQKEFEEIFSDVALMRKKIILNSIYLGGDLYGTFSKVVNGMLNTLKSRTLEGNKLSSDSEKIIANDLDEATKWLENNLITNQNISMYEFTEEELKILAKDRQTLIKEQHLKKK